MCRMIWTVLAVGALTICSAGMVQDGGAGGATKTHENVIYGMHGGLALLMDVYEPKESNGHALLFINGSGWHLPPGYGGGSLKDHPQTPLRIQPLVQMDFTVFVINHRAAPLFRYPAAIEDAQRAVRFIRHHRNRYGCASDKMAAVGHSSGGHLVLMLAVRSLPGDEAAKDPVERESAGVDAAASFAGPTDLTTRDWSSWAATVVRSFIGEPQPHPDYPFFTYSNAFQQASPISYVDPDDTPVLLVHGTEDPIVPVTQARALAKALEEVNAKINYWEVVGAEHGIEEFLSGTNAEAPTMEKVGRWLLDHLKERRSK